MLARPLAAILAALLLAPLVGALPEAPPPMKVILERLPPHCIVSVHPTIPPAVGLDCEEALEYLTRQASSAATYATDHTRALP